MESLDYKLCVVFLSLLFYHEWWSLLLFYYEWWTLLLDSSSVGGDTGGMNPRENQGGGFKVFIVVYTTLCAWVGHTYADAHIHHIGWFLSHLSTSPESMQHGFWSIICGGFTSTQFNFQCVCISGRFVFCCKICWWLWSTGSFPILELQLSFCYINFILDKL